MDCVKPTRSPRLVPSSAGLGKNTVPARQAEGGGAHDFP